MSKPMIFCAALAGAAFATTSAMADGRNGTYLSASLGAASPSAVNNSGSLTTDPYGQTVTVNGASAPYPYQTQTNFKTGLDAEVAAGFRVGLGASGAIRTEIAVDYGVYALKGASLNSTPNANYTATLSGSAVATNGLQDYYVSSMVNAFYDLPKMAGVVPYVGVGVGYRYLFETSGSLNVNGAAARAPGAASSPINLQVQVPSVRTSDGAYMAELGLSIPVSDRISLVPAYRFTNFFNGQMPINIGKVGMRMNF